uniref:Ulp1 protease family, C-terminal catalytic domain containing protein n=1 Tax=Solanum tuberosum TaxID=4113 RepID=M0ZZK6_SOLTU
MLKDFTYPISKISRLVQRYFPGPHSNINKGRLVDRFELGIWDSSDDALQMAILYFIHTFVFSQLGDAPIPIEDFFMVEDGSYKQFPWGQLAFTKLMKSFRKEYKPDKQMYRLNEFPYALNIWVYECASAIHIEIAVREGNGIPRVCNWKVVGAKPKYEMFMENIFTENDCSNVQPTQEELESLDLPNNSHVPPNRPATSVANQEEVQPDNVSDFEEFSSKPPEQLLRRCTLPRRTSSDNARLQDLEGHIKSYVDQKIRALEALIIKNHSELMKAVVAKDNKSDKDIGGISMPHIVDDSVDKGNVDLESASDQLFQQPISPIHMDFATVDHDGDASVMEVEQRLVNEENVAKIEEPSIKDFATVDHDVDANDVEVEQRHVNEENVAKDSSKAASIPSGTETVIDAIVYKLPNEPINVAPLSVIIPPQLTNSDDFLSDSQLPTQLPIKKSAHNLDTKTPAPRNRIPSKILQSPYVNIFGSSDKGKGKIDDDIRPYTPFEGCGITYQVLSLLMQE